MVGLDVVDGEEAVAAARAVGRRVVIWVVGEMVDGGGDLGGHEGEHGMLAKGLGS